MIGVCEGRGWRMAQGNGSTEAWLKGIPAGLAMFTAGFIGSALAVDARAQAAMLASVGVIVIGAALTLGGITGGAIPRYMSRSPGRGVPGRGGGDGGDGGLRSPEPIPEATREATREATVAPVEVEQPPIPDDEPAWQPVLVPAPDRWLPEAA